VSVNGQAKVSVQPDIAIINVGVSAISKTSQEASRIVATKVNQITQILQSNKIKKEDITTQSISIYPQYEYPDGKMELVGQQAQQTLTVTVRGIDKNGGNLGSIIDQIVRVDGIQFNGLSFDKEDKSEATKQARKLAFEDAKKKAQEYAGLAERTLGKALTIVDNAFDSGNRPFTSADNFIAAKSVSTQVPVGTLDVSYSVNVRFDLR
jgi:uncharacterized protein YggE